MPASDAPFPPAAWPPVEFPAPCPWHLLDGRHAVVFWRDGPGGDAWFALGQSGRYPTLDACRRELRKLQALTDFPLRAFAVAAFDPARPMAGVWRNFPDREFTLPLLLIRWRNGTASGIVYVTPGAKASTSVLHDLLGGAGPRTRSGGAAEPRSERSLFSREDWRTAVAKIRKRITEGGLEKAVLSRQALLSGGPAFEPSAMMERLSAATDGSILFAYCGDNSTDVFFGVTPERLFRQSGNRVTVDSLAGTRPRGGTTVEDRRLEEELTHSAKDRHEQELVTRYIAAQLRPLCDELQADPAPRVRKLATVQHLFTSLEGVLRPQTALDDLLAALHPTPATCGYPVAAARKLLAELEPEPRGLYAGVIGWIGADQAEFAVAIRSGLVHGGTLRLFGGAGIVAASDADHEYEECAWKMEPLRRAL